AQNGIARFSSLKLTKPGSNYAIQASANLVSAATTSPIEVLPSSTKPQLIISAGPPSSFTAGTSFGLTVTVQDVSGQVDTDFSGTIPIGLASGPAGAALGGSLTVTPNHGIAIFAGLSLERAGSYSLGATSEDASPAMSKNFQVLAAPLSRL